MYSKECVKCHKIKTSQEFYKGGGKGGLQVWCKKCCLDWYRIYRKTEKHLEYRRKRSYTKKQKQKVREYFNNPINKNRYNALQRKYRRDKTEKLKNYCRNLSHQYLDKGRIKKENCKRCDSIKSEMHHLNYNSPFNIIWLCKKCHGKEHRKSRKEFDNGLGSVAKEVQQAH